MPLDFECKKCAAAQKRLKNTGLERGWNNGGQTGDGGPDPSGGQRVGRREGCAEHGGGCVEIARVCVRAEKAGEAAGAAAAADSWIFTFPRRRHVHTTGGTSRAEGDDGNRRRTDCCLVEDERVARHERKSERAGASNQGKLLSRKRGQRERAAASAEFP